MATTLEQALTSSIATFHEWSGKDGDKYQLSEGELKELLSFMGVPPTCRNHPLRSMPTSTLLDLADDKDQQDEHSFWVLLKDREDKDNMMDFKEYVVLLGCLSMFCNDFCAEAHGPASQH